MLLFHELLTCYAPCYADSWEGGIFVASGELRWTITTQGSCKIVALIVVVHHTAKIWNEWRISVITTHLHIACTCTDIAHGGCIGWNFITTTIKIVVLETFHRVAHHDIEVVNLVECLHVSERVGPVPIYPIFHFTACFALFGLLKVVYEEVRVIVVAKTKTCIYTELCPISKPFNRTDLKIWCC